MVGAITALYAASELPLNPAVIPVQACVVARDVSLTNAYRSKFARCLGWQPETSSSLCHGAYQALYVTPLADADEIHITANDASLQAEGRSKLNGNVEVRQSERVVSAQTAYIYRDAKTHLVTRIELLGEVHYLETDRLMIAKKATINPQDKSGEVEDVLYRFNQQRKGAELPAWGRAHFVRRFANQDYWMDKATYTTCAPQDKAWQIEADEIKLDNAKAKGVAKNALLRVADLPVLYTPYLSFPTSNRRKSGFLQPMPGYSNVGGFDLALPYYWNIAPNYDATIVPHLYTLRGLMMGGDFRFLTEHTTGIFAGNFLPQDKAFNKFIVDNQVANPELRGTSSDRWSIMLHENTAFSNNLRMGINYQQISDDYYLQDFSSNLAIVTENQLLHQGDLTYTTDHWLFSGMVQGYQTLHPINQSAVADTYERLPQFLARASYNDLHMYANFIMLGEFDYFHWPAENLLQPQGPRYHLNPILSFPYTKSWGYITPALQLVENYYDVRYSGETTTSEFNRTIPRYSVDSGLTFERFTSFMGSAYTHTLEPRLFYLNVPYHNQTPVPVYDSGYMIFNNDQLFRTNRFSGFDRIGDANQLTYALTSRWLSEESGQERASFSIGQIRYFAERHVELCYQQEGSCVDSPLMLGYLSPVAKSSPIASRATYKLSPVWVASGDYVWDVYTHSTNNGNVNFHYQPATNHIVSLGYTYLGDGNLLELANAPIQNNALHQATIAYAWPLTERWSSLGVYSYNISKHYGMASFVGVQYDSCCWAMRLIGGSTFKSLSPDALTPQYTNSVYLQIKLKGLGSVANGDPATTISSYLPGYQNMF